jgi:hypothetical protein
MRFTVPPWLIMAVIFVVALTLGQTTNLTGPEILLIGGGLAALLTGPQYVSLIRAIRRRSRKDKT